MLFAEQVPILSLLFFLIKNMSKEEMKNDESQIQKPTPEWNGGGACELYI